MSHILAEPRAPQRPSRAVSIAVSVALVLAWGVVRLVAFDTVMFPLTYLIPLLVCVWTCDRLALWSMAAAFAVLHVTKLTMILPPEAVTGNEIRANLLATIGNISIGAAAVHAIIVVRLKLEAATVDLQAQADELRAQGEELAQQNEELSAQSEELSQQGEELANQNEELQSQADEIGALNASLEHRERLLETLLDTARFSGGERAALRQTVSAAFGLFGDSCDAAAIYDHTKSGLELQAMSTDADASLEPAGAQDDFAALVLHENRTAALEDTSLRADLRLPVLPELGPIRAVLCAPFAFGEGGAGVLAIYCRRRHVWTDEQFRMAEWLAAQCGRVLHALRVQAALQEADRRKGEFLATLSHELRNPLAPIRFALKLIENGRDHDNALRIMQRQMQQLVRLVDDLLDATRLSSNKIHLQKRRSDLLSVVQQAVDAAKPDIDANRHTLLTDLPAEPMWLEIDPHRIAQVVTNILNNAARYTPPGGTLTLSVGRTTDEAAITVRDTGIGIEPANVDKVFEMFAQVGGPGSGGLGIGLALVRGIVELHGGRVEVRSEGLGQGSEFRVSLPLGAPVHQDRSPEREQPTVPVQARRVLVVDDNTDGAAMMAAVIKLHGHTVWTSHDAESALATAARIVPDVALLDIGLPGMDGYELARRLRRAHPRVRLVAVTGWGQDGDRARARAAGFDAHFTKPTEPQVLLSALDDGFDGVAEA